MAPTPTSSCVEESTSFQRLSDDVVTPSHYDLDFQLSWTTSTYRCTERILVKVIRPTKEILLHAVNFEIKNCEYVEESSQVNPCVEKVSDIRNETILFVFANELSVGKGTLFVDFTGEISDASKGGLKGLYSSKYQGLDGTDRFNYLTFFAPVSARFCFPCWDEPNFKATFTVSLVLPKELIGMSNMAVLEEKPFDSGNQDKELKIIKFEQSPIMSTYLLAFAAGEFDFVEGVSSNGIKCRVYTPPDKKHLGTFALDVGMRSLSFYEEYFGIAYPLPKLDLVAIGDFPCGAMENWGLITFRETRLLVDDQKTSTENKQRVALVIAHELAHQWFGNLVTMEWWTDLWLNEGFAEFVTFLCISTLFREYDVWTQFVSMILNPALRADGLSTSHPIEIPVKSPSEIDEIFDEISYNKGASVLRMLYNFIGDTDFRRGMNLYLTRHQYSNARTSDLWKALEEVTSQPIAAMMSTWTNQMGYPLLSVDVEIDSARLKLTQEKYEMTKAPNHLIQPSQFKWLIPISLTCDINPAESIETLLFDGQKLNEEYFSLEKFPKEAKWIKVNSGGVGFYRVNYASALLQQFVPGIQSKLMPALDRVGILGDLFAVVQSGQKSTVEVLRLLQAFIEEDHCTVWATIGPILLHLDQLLSESICNDNFSQFALKLLKPIGVKIGWEQQSDEDHLQILLRPLILKLLVHFEDPETLREAKIRFNNHVARSYEIPADLRQIVFTAALMKADETLLNYALDQYRAADLAEEKIRILTSLTKIQNQELIQKVLDYSIADEVKSQDSALMVMNVGYTKNGRKLAWEFFKTNWQVFQGRFPGGFIISALVKALTENFTTEEKSVEVNSFFQEHSFRGVERSVQQSIENIGISRALLERDEIGIIGYLQDYAANL